MIRFNCPNCRREYQLPAALAGLPLVCKGCAQRFVPSARPAAEPPAPKIERSILPPPPPPVPKAEPPKPVAPPAPASTDTAANTGGDVLVSKPDSTPDIDFNVGGPTAASLSDANRKQPKGLSSAEVALPQAGSDTDRDAASVPDLDLEALARARTEAELKLPQAPAARARTEPLLELPVPPPPKALPKREPRPAPPPAPAPEAEPARRSGLIPFAADLFALVLLLAGGMLVGELLVKKHTGAVLADAATDPLGATIWAAVPLVLALAYLLLAGRGRSLGALARGR